MKASIENYTKSIQLSLAGGMRAIVTFFHSGEPTKVVKIEWHKESVFPNELPTEMQSLFYIQGALAELNEFIREYLLSCAK